jgi:hypothetical protein
VFQMSCHNSLKRNDVILGRIEKCALFVRRRSALTDGCCRTEPDQPD